MNTHVQILLDKVSPKCAKVKYDSQTSHTFYPEQQGAAILLSKMTLKASLAEFSVPTAEMERVGFTAYTATSHQGEVEI